MRHLSTFLVTLVMCAVLLEGAACAQDTSPDTQPETASESPAPPPADTLYRPYDQSDIDKVTRQGRVLRNWLIGTTAGLVVGTVLTGVGASQCSSFSRLMGSNAVACNNAGEVLVPLGGTIMVLSGIGMLTTGIMLGVRNKQKRDIEREIRRRYTARRLHFDEKSGGLAF
jgi:hypothetical protein